MLEKYQRFFDALDKLGNGERAALKRTAGKQMAEADGKALTAFYRCIRPELPQWQEERWFAVACLRCLWDAGEMSEEPIECLICRQELSDSTMHRIEILLDTQWDKDGYMLTKLTRLIKLLRQKSGIRPDLSALLEDLIYWNSENQSVQRKWARAIFAPGTDIAGE